MSRDADLRDILREHEGDLLPLVRKVYEYGFREGLAARPGAPAAVELPVAVPPPSPPPAAVPAPLFGGSARPGDPEQVDDAGEDEEEDSGDEARPVRSSITVGGLLKKINRHFGLDRFDIRVKIVDPRSDRHLMRGVRLSRYVAEES